MMLQLKRATGIIRAQWMASIALTVIRCIDYLAHGTIFRSAMFCQKKILDDFFHQKSPRWVLGGGAEGNSSWECGLVVGVEQQGLEDGHCCWNGRGHRHGDWSRCRHWQWRSIVFCNEVEKRKVVKAMAMEQEDCSNPPHSTAMSQSTIVTPIGWYLACQWITMSIHVW